MTEHNAPEQRTIDVDVADLDARGRTIVGYAAVYGAESEDLGGFTERIAPGAFSPVLGNADVRCLLNHDPNSVLGRTRSGTLRLTDEQRGLRFECDLPDSPLGQNVREAVKRGDVDGASFRFAVGTDTWDGDVRTVTAIKELHDVTVATYGAYPAASVELRTRPDTKPAAPAEKDKPPMTEPAGGLKLEDRTATDDQAPIAQRIHEGFQSIKRGESRSLTDQSAAPIAPAELATYLFQFLAASSAALRSGVQVIPTERDRVIWPKLTADVNPGWYQELDVITPADPTFTQITATPRKLAVITQVSNELYDDSIPAVSDVLNLSIVRALALKLDLAMFQGDGTANSITGLGSIAGTQTVAVGGALTNLDPIADAIGLLSSANATAGAIVVHPRTWNEVRKLKTTTGEYLLEDEPLTPADGPLPRVFGVPVFLTTQINPAVGYVYAPEQIVLVRRIDVTVEVDRSRLFNQDATEMRGKIRADLIVPNPTAVVKLTGIV